MKILIRGAGDLATGIAYMLHGPGKSILMTEKAVPLTVRRSVAMSKAVYEGRAEVEGMTAVLVKNFDEAEAIWKSDTAGRTVAVMVDEEAAVRDVYQPDVLIDAILAKKNMGTSLEDAPMVIGIGPGFTAGMDCHCVVETMRGESLGQILWEGEALANTGVPGEVAGYTKERLLRAEADGKMESKACIGDWVEKGQMIAVTGGVPVYAGMSGLIRGMLQSGAEVKRGLKIGDIDARQDRSLCVHISDKAKCVGAAVRRAIAQHGSPYAIVVAAAGEARRFGSNKLLYKVDGMPLYRRMLGTLEQFPDTMKIIVTGYKEIKTDAMAQECVIVENKEPQLGMAHSVILGVEECYRRNPNLQGILFTVCDQPGLTAATIERLLKAAREHPGAVVCAASKGVPRNPVVWDRRYREDLLSLSGDQGGRQLFPKYQEHMITIEVKAEELKDIDRVSDLEKSK